ncbi:hypothetical protein [Azospirillum sp. sgz301742]
MSVSDVTSSSVSQVQQHHRRHANGGKEVREGIDQLKTAVQSGDLEAAQKAYDSLSALQSKRQGNSSSSTSGTSTGKDDPLSKMLSQVGEALKTGDVTKVQEAFAQAGPPQGGGRGGPGGPPPGGRPPGGQGPSDDVKQAFGQLAQSLGKGDLSAAQTAYQSLSEMLGGEDDGSTSSSTSSSSKSTSSTSAADRFKELMGDLGSALQTGHLATAQSLFSSMVPRGSQGVDVMA